MAHAFLSLADGLVPRSGTATSHGSIKRHNRLTEVLLHDIEFVATLASTLGGKTAKGKAYEYPKDELDSLWERALLCQFHDVLPGSAIGMVYDDVEKVRSLPCRFLLPSGLWSDDRSMCAQIYADVTKLGVSLLDDALSALIPSSSAALDSVTAGDSLVAVDTSATPRRELVKVPLAVARALEDAAVQRSADGCAYVLFENKGTGAQVVHAEPVSATEMESKGEELVSRGASRLCPPPQKRNGADQACTSSSRHRRLVRPVDAEAQGGSHARGTHHEHLRQGARARAPPRGPHCRLRHLPGHAPQLGRLVRRAALACSSVSPTLTRD